MVINERQNDWDLHLLHVMLSSNSVYAATGLSPNESHLGRYPSLPITVFERHNCDGHQGLGQDQISYHTPARARQREAFTLVREQHSFSRITMQCCTLHFDAQTPQLKSWRSGLGSRHFVNHSPGQ